MGCGSCFHSLFKVPIKALLLSLQAAVSVAIICIIYFRLTDFTWSVNPSVELVQVSDIQCALGTTDQGTSLCNLGYAVSGISLLGTLLLVGLLFATCDIFFYITPWLELALSILGTLVWLAAALVLTSFNARANNDSTPRQDWRDTLCTLSWVNALLFFLLALLATCSVCHAVCGCGGGKGEAERRRRKAEELKARRQRERQAKQEAKRAGKKAKAATGGEAQAPAAAPPVASEPPAAGGGVPGGSEDVELGALEQQRGVLEELPPPSSKAGA